MSKTNEMHASSSFIPVQDIASPNVLLFLQADYSKEKTEIIYPERTLFVQRCAKMKDDHKT
jgi:hypothetical protein